LHEDAATTVVLYREQKAVTNLAFKLGKLDDEAIRDVLAGIEDLLEADTDTDK